MNELKSASGTKQQKANLKRVSQIQPGESVFTRSTFYKIKHLGRYPNLFVKVGKSLFVDLDQLDRIIESGRVK
ncbi:MAG: hypothetical protein GX422_05510 [Deltaproteobacteria bacterium]|jgi:preprotein translocase subunit YajC|nr:hypothetical protein [Deltaproteobacteria bacterium]